MSRIMRRAWTLLAVATLRAVRRAGELLEEFQTSERGGRPSKNGGGGSPVSQREAASRAGMSKDQEKQARRVAEVPEEEFEEAVESDLDGTLRRFRRAVTALWMLNAVLAVTLVAAVVGVV